MTARQGKMLVLGTVLLVTALLARAAAGNGEWVGFFVTELQLAIPMAIAWKVLSRAEVR